MSKSRNSNKEKPRPSDCIWKTCGNLHFDEKEPYWGRCAAMLLEMFIGYALLQGKTESIPDTVLGNLNSERFNESLQSIQNSAREYQHCGDDQLRNISMTVQDSAKQFLQMATGVQAWQLNKFREVARKAICDSRNTEAMNTLMEIITAYTADSDAGKEIDQIDEEAIE